MNFPIFASRTTYRPLFSPTPTTVSLPILYTFAPEPPRSHLSPPTTIEPAPPEAVGAGGQGCPAAGSGLADSGKHHATGSAPHACCQAASPITRYDHTGAPVFRVNATIESR